MSTADALVMHISFTYLLTSFSVTQVKLKVVSMFILHFSFTHFLLCFFARLGPTLT